MVVHCKVGLGQSRQTGKLSKHARLPVNDEVMVAEVLGAGGNEGVDAARGVLVMRRGGVSRIRKHVLGQLLVALAVQGGFSPS